MSSILIPIDDYVAPELASINTSTFKRSSLHINWSVTIIDWKWSRLMNEHNWVYRDAIIPRTGLRLSPFSKWGYATYRDANSNKDEEWIVDSLWREFPINMLFAERKREQKWIHIWIDGITNKSLIILVSNPINNTQEYELYDIDNLLLKPFNEDTKSVKFSAENWIFVESNVEMEDWSCYYYNIIAEDDNRLQVDIFKVSSNWIENIVKWVFLANDGSGRIGIRISNWTLTYFSRLIWDNIDYTSGTIFDIENWKELIENINSHILPEIVDWWMFIVEEEDVWYVANFKNDIIWSFLLNIANHNANWLINLNENSRLKWTPFDNIISEFVLFTNRGYLIFNNKDKSNYHIFNNEGNYCWSIDYSNSKRSIWDFEMQYQTRNWIVYIPINWKLSAYILEPTDQKLYNFTVKFLQNSGSFLNKLELQWKKVNTIVLNSSWKMLIEWKIDDQTTIDVINTDKILILDNINKDIYHNNWKNYLIKNKANIIWCIASIDDLSKYEIMQIDSDNIKINWKKYKKKYFWIKT